MENFSEKTVTVEQLHEKEVISIADGKRLGYPCDVHMDLCNGRIVAIVLPACGGFFGLSAKSDEIIISWENIEKIGKDIILVKCAPIVKCERKECDRKRKIF
ncbi:MAG: YlmC/YmxH family sporulation protein [Ruminococcaceae bacterium]|nr:YlmC/YmxH family sporulation protein [Oscillospiraceae bacterium]